MNLDFGVPINEETQHSHKQSINVPDNRGFEQNAPSNRNLGPCGFLSIAYYQPYFNVTQEDVARRLQSALLPIRQDFLSLIKDNPDLYLLIDIDRWGPVWISTSLVLLIAAAGNFMKLLNADQHYDFSFVPVAAVLLYTVTFCTPIVLTIMMKCFGSEIQLFQTICLYGYSMTVLVPITILCTLPYSWVHYILLLSGFGLSCFFLITNLADELSKLEQQKKYVVIGLISGMQLLLYVMFNFYFFKVISETSEVKK